MNLSIRGVLAALLAYGSWGLFPVYFKQIAAVDPVDVIAWRIVLCFFLLLLVLLVWLRPSKFTRQLKAIDQWWLLLVSAILLAVNWLVFVYAIKTNQVLQSSMGYFLVPIVSVGLGMLVFSERPNRLKLFAVIVASVGMLLTFIVAGQVPWIALILGITFGIYGMFRKKAKFDSTIGLFMETVLMLPVAILYILVWSEPLSSFDPSTRYWLYLLGVVTTVPLVSMLFAARQLELSALGFYQYLTPTIHLLLAVLVYNETLDLVRTMALVTTLIAVFFWLWGSWVQVTHQRNVKAS